MEILRLLNIVLESSFPSTVCLFEYVKACCVFPKLSPFRESIKMLKFRELQVYSTIYDRENV